MRSSITRRASLALAAAALTSSAWTRALHAGETQMTSIAKAASAYLDAWARKDLDGIAAHLHPDVHFKAPMQELTGREQVLAAAARIFPLLERLVTRAQFFSADATMFCYDFVCREPIGVSRTAEWVRFDGLLIREIELFFDARPFEALQRAQAQRRPAK